jgi:hypothetical protein
MYCQQCGAQLDGGAGFCVRCGTPAPSRPVIPSGPDPAAVLKNHLHVLGILWLVYSIFHIITGAWSLVFSHYFLPTIAQFFPQNVNQDALLHLFGLFRVFYAYTFIYSVATGALGLWTGWALLRRERNGRILALVAAFFSLLSIPFGTALAAYTLVILLPERSGPAYEQLSQAVTL